VKRKILFIINPKAGMRAKKLIPDLIKKYVDESKIDFEIAYTEFAWQAIELAANAVKKNYDSVIAIGGDGSVNEIAQSLVHSNTSLGIIPFGSGNGLARHLKIPLKIKKAIDVINKGSTISIDVCKWNDKFFFSNAGVGFVSAVVHTFKDTNFRGFFGYSFHVLRNTINFKSTFYKLDLDEKKLEGNFMLVSVANSNQFGYEFKISPEANLQDGLMNVVIVKKIPKWKFPSLLLALTFRTLHRNSNVLIYPAKKIIIESEGKHPAQLDGDISFFENRVGVEIEKSALNVLAS
jgi:diacylglycerol kinase (ATP)